MYAAVFYSSHKKKKNLSDRMKWVAIFLLIRGVLYASLVRGTLADGSRREIVPLLGVKSLR